LKFPQIAVMVRPRPRETECLNAIASTLQSNGYKIRVTHDLTAPEAVVFVWSWGRAMTQREKYPNAIICTVDHGYTRDRANLFNTGWSLPHMTCGLNGFAEHPWVHDGGTRAEAMGWADEIKPYRRTGLMRALLLGQVYGDAMIVTQVRDYKGWLAETAHALVAEGYGVTFRPHPVMVRRGQSLDYGNLGRLTGPRPLMADLSETDLAVGLNSNGLVEAFLRGVSARAYNGGTMLAPILEDGEANALGRREWLNALAYTQWTLDELKDGTWFKHHRPILHRLVNGGPVFPWCERHLTP